MFTGIIEATGFVREINDRRGDKRIIFDSGNLDITETRTGDSIAVNGVCLTIIEHGEKSFATDISEETLACTTFDKLERGIKVNLEKAMQLSDRLHGHLVSGHVDGIGIIRQRKKESRSEQFIIEAPSELMKYICRKGSISVDGVSLTVNARNTATFSINIIPHTLQETTFGGFKAGSRVNLEVDLIARYLETLLPSTA